MLFFTSFLANSNETTLNAYETTTSATTSTESDINTYDVNNSDVNISETLALNSLTSSADVESTRKWVFLVSWSPGPSLKNSEWKCWFHPLFLHFFSSIFLKIICVLTLMPTVFGKCQAKIICILIYQNFLCLHIIFLTQAGLAYL